MDSNSDGISGDVSSGRLNRTGARSVQMDRDTIFTAQFRQMLTHSDREVKQTPPQQPWKNGHIERFVQTLKNLVLRKVFCLSELALHEAVLVGIRHYNGHRPHQSLDNQPPLPLQNAKPDLTKPVIRVDLLGGAIHQYGRVA